MVENFLWEDRRRILGMPITFTKYKVSKTRLVHTEGLFFIKEGQISLFKILDLELRYNLLDRILGVGTIILYTKDISDKTFQIVKVKNPRNVLSMLDDYIKESKKENNIQDVTMYQINQEEH